MPPLWACSVWLQRMEIISTANCAPKHQASACDHHALCWLDLVKVPDLRQKDQSVVLLKPLLRHRNRQTCRLAPHFCRSVQVCGWQQIRPQSRGPTQRRMQTRHIQRLQLVRYLQVAADLRPPLHDSHQQRPNACSLLLPPKIERGAKLSGDPCSFALALGAHGFHNRERPGNERQ